ncbi:NAD(P)-dependent oxidoreductase [Pontibacter sp. HSC-14F20]|uniref:NAD-dependent epimerase/dehydratase family protein n=1 Tax=Pontibacter sp. HSC-14F20 TaxID=2864136 RepID=UPI001C731E22|nr:NAD(P)-dependent oxidoreductase [Pontibacter sp. HSC-14F20]MBX0333254.1 NAD(P)-dependent oxidoreductase [Pontibacter sp. HSC-14F20]
MKRTAVIGANGFLGRKLLSVYMERGHSVTAVYNRNFHNIPNSSQALSFDHFINGDLFFDNIVFAAGNFSSTHEELIALNCKGLLEITARYPNARLVYISSTNVYGTHTSTINEDSTFNIPTLYGRAKLAGEFIVSALKSFAIIRLAYLYGPGLQNKSFLPTIINDALHNKKIVLMGKGEREQDYLHVNDAADLCFAATNYPENGVFLGATGQSISNIEVAKNVCAKIDCCLIEFTGEERGTSFYFDPVQTFDKLNWRPKVAFIDGIKSCI